MTIRKLPDAILRKEIHNTVTQILKHPDSHKQELLQQLLDEATFRNLH